MKLFAFVLVAASTTVPLITASTSVAYATTETTAPHESREQGQAEDASWGDSRPFWRWALQGDWTLFGPESIAYARQIVFYVERSQEPTAEEMTVAGLNAKQQAQVLQSRRLEFNNMRDVEILEMRRVISDYHGEVAQPFEIRLTISLSTLAFGKDDATDGYKVDVKYGYEVLSMDAHQLSLRVTGVDGNTEDMTITLPFPGYLTLKAPSLGEEALVFRR